MSDDDAGGPTRRRRRPCSAWRAEHPTRLWNDSATLTELSAAIGWGAVGATCNPVIALAALRSDLPALAARIAEYADAAPHRLGVRDRLGDGPRAVGRGGRAAHRRLRRRPAAATAGSRSRPTPGSTAMPQALADQAVEFDAPGAQHHREDPGHRAGHRGDGGGHLPRGQHQRDGLLHRAAGGRRGRGHRAWAGAPARPRASTCARWARSARSWSAGSTTG